MDVRNIMLTSIISVLIVFIVQTTMKSESHLSNKDVTESDRLKGNLLFISIVAMFIILTTIAYLCTDGRSHCIVPFLRRYFPHARMLAQYDKQCAEKKFLKETAAAEALLEEQKKKEEEEKEKKDVNDKEKKDVNDKEEEL